MCLTNKALLTFFDRRREKRLSFVNIREPDYSPSKHGGVSYADAMRHFHVIDGDHVAEGSEAILTAYTKVGLGWLMGVLRFPLIRWLVDGLYAVISRHRYTSEPPTCVLTSRLPNADRTCLAVVWQSLDCSPAALSSRRP